MNEEQKNYNKTKIIKILSIYFYGRKYHLKKSSLQYREINSLSSVVKTIYNMYQISFELKCNNLYTRILTLVEVHVQHSTWSEFILYVYICVANINSVYSCVYEWFYMYIKLTRKKFNNKHDIIIFRNYSRLIHVHKAIYRTIKLM